MYAATWRAAAPRRLLFRDSCGAPSFSVHSMTVSYRHTFSARSLSTSTLCLTSSLLPSAPLHVSRRSVHTTVWRRHSSSSASSSVGSALTLASGGSGSGGACGYMSVSAMTTGLQVRSISWNPKNWGRSDVGRHSSASVEEELPEIFANQPIEVDDYIRPDKSIFERLEDFWDWAVSFMQPVEKQVEIMRGLRNDGLFGFDLGGWGHVFFFYGIMMRLFTMIPSLYSNRNGLRMTAIGAQLSEITSNQQKVKNDRTLSTAEKRVIKDGYNRMKYALCKKHGCAQWKSFLAMITAPITMSAFLSIRRLAMYETDLEMAPFLWVKDLTMPDPTFALPAICSLMFLLNFEMSQRMQKGVRSSSNMYIRWAVRGGSVVGIYFFAAQPSAMFAYWIGLSTAGLLQPLLLRWQPFRDFFGFPDPPQAARAELISEIKGPSLYEKLFASKEEKARREAERQAERETRQRKQFQRIDEFDVVFDTPGEEEEGGKEGEAKGKGGSASPGISSTPSKMKKKHILK